MAEHRSPKPGVVGSSPTGPVPAVQAEPRASAGGFLPPAVGPAAGRAPGQARPKPAEGWRGLAHYWRITGAGYPGPSAAPTPASRDEGHRHRARAGRHPPRGNVRLDPRRPAERGQFRSRRSSPTVRDVDLLDGTITLFVLGLGAGALALVAIARQKHGLAIGLLIASFAAISLIAMFFIALLIVLDSA